MFDRTGRRRFGSLLTLLRAAPALLLLTMAALAACGGDSTGVGNDRATTTPEATAQSKPEPTRPSATATTGPEATAQSKPEPTRPSAAAAITPEATEDAIPEPTRPSATSATAPEATEEADSASPKLAGVRDGNDTPSFVSVSAGEGHTCGVRSDDSAACWGEDGSGQATPPEGSFVSVSAGFSHTCGVRSDGSVACWGDDEHGQSSPPGAP